MAAASRACQRRLIWSKALQQPSVLEKLVDFEKEISVIVARNASGEVTAFPVVELSFHPEHNLVDSLLRRPMCLTSCSARPSRLPPA